MNKKLKGDFGEDLAASFLEKKGYKIISRNFRGSRGEIDIIATKEGIVSFIEVKSRSNTSFGSAASSVTLKKQNSIILTANEYIAEHELFDCNFSFDVIEVNLNNNTINHIINAFDTSGR